MAGQANRELIKMTNVMADVAAVAIVS